MLTREHIATVCFAVVMEAVGVLGVRDTLGVGFIHCIGGCY